MVRCFSDRGADDAHVVHVVRDRVAVHGRLTARARRNGPHPEGQLTAALAPSPARAAVGDGDGAMAARSRYTILSLQLLDLLGILDLAPAGIVSKIAHRDPTRGIRLLSTHSHDGPRRAIVDVQDRFRIPRAVTT